MQIHTPSNSTHNPLNPETNLYPNSQLCARKTANSAPIAAQIHL